MSHPSPHTPAEEEGDPSPTLKPRPRRPFELSSAPPSAPPTPPSDAQALLPTLDTTLNNIKEGKGSFMSDGASTPSRTRSFLNLTTSTLFGIYQPAGGLDTENPTPWGTGAQTPAADSRGQSFDFSRVQLPDAAYQQDGDGRLRRKSAAVQVQRPTRVQQKGFWGYAVPLMGRMTALFGVGMLYGLLIGHLHDRQQIAPVPVNLDRSRWSYLITWGFIGALLGEILPKADQLWAPQSNDAVEKEVERGRSSKSARGMDAWMDVVRSIGAFVGIAFAIRKLPWQSTLQLSLTLALANPAVWFIVDRSPPGFIVSTLVAVSGTAILLGINPALIPSPSPWQMLQGHVDRHHDVNGTFEIPDSKDLVAGIFSQESVGIATWIASVLFVSSVCFGNIGRRLAPQRT